MALVLALVVLDKLAVSFFSWACMVATAVAMDDRSKLVRDSSEWHAHAHMRFCWGCVIIVLLLYSHGSRSLKPDSGGICSTVEPSGLENTAMAQLAVIIVPDRSVLIPKICVTLLPLTDAVITSPEEKF